MKNGKKTGKQVYKQASKPKSLVKAKAQKPQMQTIPKGLIKALGSLAGGYLGGPLGGLAGGVAGEGISRISGFGDYMVKSNTLTQHGTSSNEVPTFVPTGMNSVRIRHREYIGDLVSQGTGFNAYRYRLNPGAIETFPWLSSFAPKFQQYKLHGAVVQFKSTSSEYASGAALGAVVIATNYTPTDNAYTSKSDMENTGFCVSAKPSLSIVHAIECDPRSQTMAYKYIRDNSNPVTDANLFDWGVTTVAVSGLSAPAATAIGELWLSYDIELIRPVSLTNGAANIAGASAAGAPTITACASGPIGIAGSLNSYWSLPQMLSGAIQNAATYNPVTSTTTPVLTIDAVGNTWYFYRPGTYSATITVTGAGTAFVGSLSPFSTYQGVNGCTVTLANVFSSAVGDSVAAEYTFTVGALGSLLPSVNWTKLAAWTTATNIRAEFIIRS